jgi:uncharacterized repeat protein (TIGR02543 family)
MTIPASVTSIGDGAFQATSALKSVTFTGTSQLKTIGRDAFQSSGITSIGIPTGVTTIGDYAFSFTPALASITIPASVTSIGGEAFYDASALTTIMFLGSIDQGSEEMGTVSLPNLNRDGYTFTGWYSDAKFTTKVGDINSRFSVSQATNLYANLTKKAEATTKPSITGTAKVSKTLTAVKGVWTGFPDPTFSYQWYSCTAAVATAIETVPRTCAAIRGATKTTFPVTKTYKNKYLAVKVTGQSSGTTATQWLSRSTAKVK